MQDARCANNVSVLLSTALAEPGENATERDLDGIYQQGWVSYRAAPAWYSVRVEPGRTHFERFEVSGESQHEVRR